MATTGEEISVRFVGTSVEAEAASERASVAITSAVERMKGGFVGLAETSKVAMGEVGVSAEGAAAATEGAAVAAETALGRWKLSMRGLAQSATEAREQVAVQFEAMAGIMEHLNVIMLAVGAALAGGALFKEAVSAATEFDTHTLKLSKTLGITLEAASGLHVALHGLGIETDTYTGAALRLTRQLRTHEESLNKMGIVTRGAGGELLNMQTIMTSTIGVLRNMEEGTNRNLAAQVAFGRGAGDLTQMLRLNKQEMDEGAETAKRLGLILNIDGVKAMVEYKKSMHEAKLTMEALNIVLGRALLPALTAVSEWITGEGAPVIRGFKKLIGGLGDVFNIVGDIIRAFGAIVSDWFTMIGDIVRDVVGGAIGKFNAWDTAIATIRVTIIAFGNIVREVFLTIEAVIRIASGVLVDFLRIAKSLATLDLTGAKQAFRDLGDDIAKNAIASAKKMEDAYTQASARIKAAVEGEKGAKKGAYNDPTTGAGNTLDPNDLKKAPKKKKEKADPSQMPALEEGLSNRKANLDAIANAEGTFREFSKAQEAAYWGEILKRTDLSTKDRSAVLKRFNADTLSARKEAFTASIDAITKEIEAEKGEGDKRIALAKERAAKIAAAYGAGSVQAINAEAEVTKVVAQEEAKRTKLAIEGVKARKEAALGIIAIEEEYAKHGEEMHGASAAKMLALDLAYLARKHDAEVKALADELALQTKGTNEYAKILTEKAKLNAKYRLDAAKLDDKFEADKFKKFKAGIDSLATSWSQALGKMASMQAGFGTTVQSMWQSLMGGVLGAIEQMIAKQLSAWLAAEAVKLGIGKLMGIHHVATESAKAGAGGIASMAAAPFPLNMTAPAFGASMAAGAAGFGSILSARGGYDIPAGLNPITQLHEREMVLPAKQADVIRDMANGGSTRGGGDTIIIHAVDAKSFKQLLMDHPDAVAGAVKKHVRANGRNVMAFA